MDGLIQTFDWSERIQNVRTLLGVAVASTILGLVMGLLGSAGLGRRGRLYGAMMGGMVLNLYLKGEGASYLAAFAGMVGITLITFALGWTRWLKLLFRPKHPRVGVRPGE